MYLAINLFCIFNNTYQGSKKRDCSNLTFIFSFIGITYLLVYRTDKYKKLTAEVEKDSKKCEYLCYCRVFNYLLFSDQESWTTIQCLKLDILLLLRRVDLQYDQVKRSVLTVVMLCNAW